MNIYNFLRAVDATPKRHSRRLVMRLDFGTRRRTSVVVDDAVDADDDDGDWRWRLNGNLVLVKCVVDGAWAAMVPVCDIESCVSVLCSELSEAINNFYYSLP